ncbi:MAG: hypothetical protein ACJA2M_000895 [Polaribacter sp.]|jgi:hypothetical protein
MLSLLQNISKNTSVSIDNLLFAYEEYFFSIMRKNYFSLLAFYKDPIEML